MCCLCAVPLRNGSVQLGTKRHGREGDSNGPADLADNPSNSLGYFQAVRQFKSLFLLLSCYNYLHFEGTDPRKASSDSHCRASGRRTASRQSRISLKWQTRGQQAPAHREGGNVRA